MEMEWNQVRNYVALESLRYEDRVTVTLSLDGEADRKMIAPMILLTLVENAFKHGVMSVSGKSWIHVRVSIQQQELNIQVRNSQRSSPSGHGIGLQNLRARLRPTLTTCGGAAAPASSSRTA